MKFSRCVRRRKCKKIDELLEKNRREGLSEAEEQTWASYEFVEHLVRIVKVKAKKQLK